ncbi:mRNA splicing factor Cwf18 [Penicillium cf. griseofulvum]|uniref:mRNA splicing factor Cwf18 n=1 Tax=Penicillium cf. griseofulvum TaxID=2972120 RepID=A0A9W9M1X5_9EURO|nr:mRNA splicing factor Cwf18 [Penicillium cf. griseofulvum]
MPDRKLNSAIPPDFAVASVWRTTSTFIGSLVLQLPSSGGAWDFLLVTSVTFLPHTQAQISSPSSFQPSLENMSSNHANLDAASIDRKARLAKLAALKRKQPEPDTKETSAEEQELPDADAKPDVTTKYLSGRNYDPETRGPKLGFEQGPQEGQVTLEAQAAEIAKATAEQAKQDAGADEPIDLFKLQPKKPNWDLKRDLNEKLKTLDVRTDNAIARLLRQRVEDAQRAAKARGAKSNGDEQGEEVGMEGETLVEGIHMREREEEKSDEETI